MPAAVVASARSIVWFDQKGNVAPVTAQQRHYIDARISPDGQRIAVSVREQRQDIWVHDVTRGALTRLTFEGMSHAPAWSPDSRYVFYGSVRAHPRNIFRKRADGSGDEERLTSSDHPQYPGSVSPDGAWLAYAELNPQTAFDIWLLPLAGGDRKPQRWLATPHNDGHPAFSPDGKWLAYESAESNRSEIYVQPFPSPGGKWQISTDGGAEPMWTRDGRGLFYHNGNKVMVVDVSSVAGRGGDPATLAASHPRVLFDAASRAGLFVDSDIGRRRFDVHPDGRRFLTVVLEDKSVQPQLHVVLDWFQTLRQAAN